MTRFRRDSRERGVVLCRVPVAAARHPQADRGNRGGVGAQYSGAKRYRDRLRQGADHFIFRVGKAAFRADQDRGGAAMGGQRLLETAFAGGMDALVGEEQLAVCRPYFQQRGQFCQRIERTALIMWACNFSGLRP